MKCRCCLQLIVKFLNLLLFVVGLSMILYSVWMLQQLKDDDYKPPEDLRLFADARKLESIARPFLSLVSKARADITLPTPWFIYAFMGLGILVCLITFFGYIAAEAASGCCLCCSSISLGILLVVEASLAATVFFDQQWEQDIPEDPTGQIHKMRRFVESHADYCKLIALIVIVLQALTLLFGLILRAVVGDFRRSGYDSDDDDYEIPRTSFRHSLARQPTQTSSSSSAAPLSHDLRNDAWSTRLKDKGGEYSESRRLLQPNASSSNPENKNWCCIM